MPNICPFDHYHTEADAPQYITHILLQEIRHLDISAQHTGYLSTIQSIRAILFAILFTCMGHGLLTYLVPTTLSANGVNETLIGIVLSFYSVGFFLGCFFSGKIIRRVGHIRTYSAVVSIISIAAVLHSFYGNFIFTCALRFFVGAAMAAVYITLESWLNGSSSSTSRGTILGVYQAAVALGFGISPWLLNLLGQGDPRFYSLVALMLAVSVIPLAISRRPAPQIPDSASVYPFKQLFFDSPAAFVGTFGAGLITLPATQLMIVFLADNGYSGTTLSLILSGAFLGSFLFQVPVGKLADKYDKRKVYLSLLILMIVVSVLTLVNYSTINNVWVLAISYLLFVGCCNCLHPLSITLLFDQIDLKNAVNATASMTVVHGAGLIVGPIMAGWCMNAFGTYTLFSYSIFIALGLVFFLIIRIYLLKITINQENLPYFMSMQSIRPSNLNLNPAMDYLITQIDDPTFSNLVNALSHADDTKAYTQVMESSLFKSGMIPDKIILNLVLSLPRKCDKTLKAMLSLHPDLRQELAIALHDLIRLDKKRINLLLLKGLSYKATRQQRSGLKKYFHESIEEEKKHIQEKLASS